MSGLLLGAVAGTSLLTTTHARGVERAADDLVTHTGEVLHTTTTHEHDAVLLEVVVLTGDVCGDLDAAGQAHTGDLAQRRVRLLGSGGEHACARAAALRCALQGRRRLLAALALTALADQLLDRGHGETS